MPIFLFFSRVFATARHYRVVALLATALLIVLVGAGLFALSQGISYAAGLYWAITTATTVGYGDVTPHNVFGRVIASIVMLTTIPIVGAVFAMVAGASAVVYVRRILGMESHLPAEPYTIIFGLHPIVPQVVLELARAGDPTVLVAHTRPPGLPDSVELVAGDPTDDEVIARSQPDRANRALIACIHEADTLVVAVALHSLAPNLRVYALTQSRRVARALTELGITHTLAGDELLGHTIAKSLETPEAGDLMLQLVEATGYCLEEQIVDESLAAQSLSRARATPGRLVLGIARDGQVDLGVGDDPTLAAGDRLIVLHERA